MTMKEELWTPDELKREEIRGVFVIGLIATFLSIRPYIQIHESNQLLNSQELINGILLNFTTFLIAFWGIYLFLILVSLADDIKLPSKENEEMLMTKENFSNIKTFAQFMFIMGLYMSFIYGALIFFVLLVGITFILALILAIILPFKLLYKLFLLLYRFVLMGLTRVRNHSRRI